MYLVWVLTTQNPACSCWIDLLPGFPLGLGVGAKTVWRRVFQVILGKNIGSDLYNALFLNHKI